MESTNYMNPKYWLIGVGAVNLLFSLYNFFDASGVAEIALTDHYGALSDRELAIATGYEEGWGLFGIPYGILAIGAGLVLDSDGQAKMIEHYWEYLRRTAQEVDGQLNKTGIESWVVQQRRRMFQ